MLLLKSMLLNFFRLNLVYEQIRSQISTKYQKEKKEYFLKICIFSLFWESKYW